MPYWVRLLQADILPQKLSRRSRIDIFEGVSGVACTSTGTRRSAIRSVSAMARSSPKFGSDTTTPSSVSRFFRNKSAHLRASSRVSTAPNFVSSMPTAMALWPPASIAAIMSRRPLAARWSGKNPLFPIMSPKFIALSGPFWREMERVPAAQNKQQNAPPYPGVQIRQHHRVRGRIHILIDAFSRNHHSVKEQQDADKKPDRDHSLVFAHVLLPDHFSHSPRVHYRSLTVAARKAYQTTILRTTRTIAMITA